MKLWETLGCHGGRDADRYGKLLTPVSLPVGQMHYNCLTCFLRGQKMLIRSASPIKVWRKASIITLEYRTTLTISVSVAVPFEYSTEVSLWFSRGIMLLLTTAMLKSKLRSILQTVHEKMFPVNIGIPFVIIGRAWIPQPPTLDATNLRLEVWHFVPSRANGTCHSGAVAWEDRRQVS